MQKTEGILFRLEWHKSAQAVMMTSHGGEEVSVKSEEIIQPADLMQKVLSLCESKGLPALPYMGMRYISCGGETFYLGFSFNQSAGSTEILEDIVSNLSGAIKEIIVPTEHMVLNEETREWTPW